LAINPAPSGSVRGHLRERGDAFQLIIYAGRDELTGKRRYVRKTVPGTKREAQNELARLLIEVGSGHHVAVAGTFGGLLDRWYHHAAPDWSPAPA
jgi:hypothetical protein